MTNQNEIARAQLAFDQAREDWQRATTEAYRKWDAVKKNLDPPTDVLKKIERDEALTERETEHILSSPDKKTVVDQIFGKVDGELRDRVRSALERLNALRNG